MDDCELPITVMLGHGRLPVGEIKPAFGQVNPNSIGGLGDSPEWAKRNGLNRVEMRARPGLDPTYEHLASPSLGRLPLLGTHHRREHSSNAAIRLCVDVLPVRDYPILEKQAQIYSHGSGQRTSLEASPFVLLTVSEAQPLRTS